MIEAAKQGSKPGTAHGLKRAGSVGLLLSWVAISLACSGLMEAPPPPNPDEGDPAEAARRVGDFPLAEKLLSQRLAQDPNDVRSWRLLGDVHITRGQEFKQRWKENLGWGIDSYVSAVRANPEYCPAWNRLAAAVVAAYENEETRVLGSRIGSLPLKRGEAACEKSTAFLELAFKRDPRQDEFEMAQEKLGYSADPWKLLLATHEGLEEQLKKLNIDDLNWREPESETPFTSGMPFVVLESTTAKGLEGAVSRSADKEILRIGSVQGASMVFLDRKMPARRPDVGTVRSPACGGTEWTLDGPDRYPVGRCNSGPASRRLSSVYDNSILRESGPSHYVHSTIAKSALGWEGIVDGSVQCRPGPVGRLLVDVPTCQVDYDHAIYRTRAVPKTSGVAAFDDDHAWRILVARGLGSLYGEEGSKHLSRGEVADPLPYSLAMFAMSDLKGCVGRGLFQKLELDGEITRFTCQVGTRELRFEDLMLVDIVAKP